MKKIIILAFIFGFLSPTEAFWFNRLPEEDRKHCEKLAARERTEFSAKRTYKNCKKNFQSKKWSTLSKEFIPKAECKKQYLNSKMKELEGNVFYEEILVNEEQKFSLGNYEELCLVGTYDKNESNSDSFSRDQHYEDDKGNNTKIIKTKFANIIEAGRVTAVKMGIYCLSKNGQYMNKDQRKNYLQNQGLTEADLEDDLINLLFPMQKKYISNDCSYIDEKKYQIEVNNILKLNKIEWADKEPISLEDFGGAVGILSGNQCSLDKGILNTQQEFIKAIQEAFIDAEIPLIYGSDPLIIEAALEVTKYRSSDCSEFTLSDLELGKIILKYFKKQ